MYDSVVPLRRTAAHRFSESVQYRTREQYIVPPSNNFRNGHVGVGVRAIIDSGTLSHDIPQKNRAAILLQVAKQICTVHRQRNNSDFERARSQVVAKLIERLEKTGPEARSNLSGS